MSSWPLLLATLSAAAMAVPVAAQPSPDPPPADPPPHVAHVEGEVDIVQDGQRERVATGALLLAGDALATRRGRAEIVYPDGTVLHLDVEAALEVLSPERLRLTAGRLIARTSAASQRLVVDTPAASAELAPRGEYVVAVGPRGDDAAIGVARGGADVETASQRVVVRSGERVEVLPAGAARLRGFNTARWDAFDRWAADRMHAFTLATSARWLPVELRPYGPVLDRHGWWGHRPEYGSVWYPRVGPGWRPYVEGWWRHTPYGWTWIGLDPWAWPTHHYGRWEFAGGVWFWIPARVWAPAWVAWGYAPGSVCWAPVGWHDRPLVPLSVTGARSVPSEAWRAWTVMPHSRLGVRGNVRAWTVDGRRLPTSVRHAVQVGGRPGWQGPPAPVMATSSPLPAGPRVAVPRDEGLSRGLAGAVAPGDRRADAPTRRAVPRAAAAPAEERGGHGPAGAAPPHVDRNRTGPRTVTRDTLEAYEEAVGRPPGGRGEPVPLPPAPAPAGPGAPGEERRPGGVRRPPS